jgi:hypothetical protein
LRHSVSAYEGKKRLFKDRHNIIKTRRALTEARFRVMITLRS